MTSRTTHQKSPQPKPPRVPIPAQLTEILADLPTLVSTAGQGFALLPCAGAHTSYNVTLKAPALQHWLLHRSINRGIPIPSYTQLRDTLRGLAARCHAGGPSRHRTHLRTAWNPTYHTPDTDPHSAILLALDTRAGSHAVITRDGWSVDSTKTNFLYDQVQQPLPRPLPSASAPEAALEPFRKLLRLDAPQHHAAWQTLLSWTLAALRPAREATFHDYPILNLVGPHTSGKSVTAKILTLLLDPTGTPIHAIPSTERRLHSLAATHHILAFDDPGKINPEKSRHLSRLSSGIASLHPDLQGMLVRPIILTTNDEKETKHLAHRVVDVTLPPLDTPLSAQEIGEQFEAMRPAVLGAILTLLSRDFDGVPLLLPNRQTKKQKIEQSVPQFVADQGGAWSGTVTDLQTALPFDVSTKALGEYLKGTQSLQITRKKSNKIKTVTLASPLERHSLDLGHSAVGRSPSTASDPLVAQATLSPVSSVAEGRPLFVAAASNSVKSSPSQLSCNIPEICPHYTRILEVSCR